MTRSELYSYGIKRLASADIAEATIDAWVLFEEATRVTRATYYADMNATITKECEERYMQWIEKRAMRVPLQHILGFQEFMGLNFLVTPAVLIPRQDTETLVERIEMLLQAVDEPKDILDMCTGSGCILLSLLKRNKNITGTAVDISDEALTVAKENAKRLNVNANFVQSNLFDNVQGTYDVIVSNPPYIEEKEIESLEIEVKKFDPFLALNGGEDGLTFYRKIVKESSVYLKRGGHLFFEIGQKQAKAVSEMMKLQGFDEIKVCADLAGLDRVVHGVYNK